jgi:hypothetical protein
MAVEQTEAFDVPPTETGPVPVSYQQVERRTFGVPPNTLVATLGALALTAGGVLMVAGRLVSGSLLLAAALLLGALFVEQARRRRASVVDRAAAAAVDNSRALAGFAGASVRTWASAGRRVAQLRLETKRLVRERSRAQYELGAAAFAADENLTEELRTRMHDLDARIEACGAQAQQAIERARSRTSEERLAVGSTEILPPGDARD